MRMPMSRRSGIWDGERSFDGKIAMANNPIAELVRSLAHEDEPATIVAAVRLRRALEIDGVSIAGADLTRARLARSILRDVHADGAKLDQLEATGATFLFVQAVASSLRLATFDRCLVEQSDFSRANLERSTWRSASVFGTGFAGAALADVRLDDALFVECDFRGADLGTVNLDRVQPRPVPGLSDAICGRRV